MPQNITQNICTAQGLWVWLAEAVQQTDGLYIAAHWCSIPLALQEMYAKMVWTDEALLPSLLTCTGPQRCM